MKTYRIVIEGMGCQHCIDGVTQALTQAGAQELRVELGTAVARFGGDAGVLRAAIEALDFDVISMAEEG